MFQLELRGVLDKGRKISQLVAKMESVVAALILFACLSLIGAAVVPKIPDGKTVKFRVTTNNFKVHIKERGTKFVETIQIDEKNGVEKFHVPSHNGLNEADYLYDFKRNLTVTRVKSEGGCYLTSQLPDKLPKPVDLKTGLQRAPQTRPSKKALIVQKYWVISEQVNKTLLSQEVQDFCGQLPVFRLREYHLNPANGTIKRNTGQTRFARNIIDIPALCTGSRFQFPACPYRGHRCCNPGNWIYKLYVRGSCGCTYLVSECKLNRMRFTCTNTWKYHISSRLCYTVVC